MNAHLQILFSSRSGALVLGTRQAFKKAWADITAFIASATDQLELAAAQTADPGPYERALLRVVIERRESPIQVGVQGTQLLVAGAPENLQAYFCSLLFDENAESGDHHHPEHMHRQNYVAAGAIPVTFELE